MPVPPYCVPKMSECEIKILPNAVLLSEAAGFLSSGMDVVIPVKGNSMLPFIRSGKDLVLLRSLDAVQEGDVVLALDSDGRYVLHRVIEAGGDGTFTLRGDGNLRGTETCRKEDIIGTAIEVKKPSGKTFSPRRDRNWQKLPLILRRVILALYKRLFVNG